MIKKQMKRLVFRKIDKTASNSTKGVRFVTFHPKLTFLAKKMKEFFKYLRIYLYVCMNIFA